MNWFTFAASRTALMPMIARNAHDSSSSDKIKGMSSFFSTAAEIENRINCNLS
jgi:hypothetical protein